MLRLERRVMVSKVLRDLSENLSCITVKMVENGRKPTLPFNLMYVILPSRVFTDISYDDLFHQNQSYCRNLQVTAIPRR